MRAAHRSALPAWLLRGLAMLPDELLVREQASAAPSQRLRRRSPHRGTAVARCAAGAAWRSRRPLRAPSCSAWSASPRVLNLWALGQNGWANTYYSRRRPLDGVELAQLPVRVAGPERRA